MQQKTILYGVQGTGNGHISRARLMANQFKQLDAQVDFVFTGRSPEQYFDMEDFANKTYGEGLSFVTDKGRIQRLKTLANTHPLRFITDLMSLRTDRYDLVLTDFEPTSAWAARLRGTPSLALGHQYALDGKAPRPVGDHLSKWVVKQFAPANNRIGFHWAPYNAHVLPPMVDTTLTPINTGQSYTLVYLPFEDLKQTVAQLQQIRGEHFVIYSSEVTLETQRRNVSIYPLSKSGFRHHLQRCDRVICNTGFELISEAIHLGIPILTKPLEGQYEQMANAQALRQLKLATVTRNIGVLNLDKFINTDHQIPQTTYPDVAKSLADHCLQSQPEPIEDLARRLWSQVVTPAASEADDKYRAQLRGISAAA